MKLVKRWSGAFRLQEGQVFPRGWGMAWWGPGDYCYIAPIPVNFVLGWLMALYRRLQRGYDSSAWHEEMRRQREVGYEQGRRAGMYAASLDQGLSSDEARERALSNVKQN